MRETARDHGGGARDNFFGRRAVNQTIPRCLPPIRLQAHNHVLSSSCLRGTERQIQVCSSGGHPESKSCLTSCSAWTDRTQVPNIELRISLASGHPLDPYYLPLLANKAVVFSGDDVKPMYEGADVVICALGPFHFLAVVVYWLMFRNTAYTASQAGLVSQLKAIRLAAGAGVKLFVPCEYSLEFDDIETSPHEKGKTLTVEDMANEEYPLVKLRREAVDLCKELGMPCLRVITGGDKNVRRSHRADGCRDHPREFPC